MILELHLLIICAVTFNSASTEQTFGDINDPKTNLDYFVRTAGSKDPNVSSVNYINGSVFAKQPGAGLQKLFNFEGYNINRKVLQSNGSYLSLSCEFVVYRDPVTHIIQKVWINPWSREANEVLAVHNNPVNALLKLGNVFPTQLISDERVVFNTDVLLEYPNALDPGLYPKYSAGPVYEAAELFAFFANLTQLTSDTDWSVPMTGTWIRRSQYLPWMEMGNTTGHLYYTTFSWKCKYKGLGCVANDIMKIIDDFYPEYKKAPLADDVPNETSWTVFKATVDKRRKAGLPDIIIPTSGVVQNMSTYDTAIDQRIKQFFTNVDYMPTYFNGTAWSQITGKQSINLFNIEGLVFPRVTESSAGFYTLSLTGSLFYRDVTNGSMLSYFPNPITGVTNVVPNPTTFWNKTFNFPKDFVYSMDISPSNVLGLLAAQSEETCNNSGEWSVNILDMLFDPMTFYSTQDVFFYGTAGRFSNWLNWMDMAGIQGNMAFKATFYRELYNRKQRNAQYGFQNSAPSILKRSLIAMIIFICFLKSLIN